MNRHSGDYHMQCPKCSSDNIDTNKFCGNCGQKLLATKSPVQTETSIGGERKHATVMFSDLSAYTSMTEKLDPEEVKRLMGDIFKQAETIVNKYQGTVERFFGDEIMILFGVPKAHEDDPVRAIHTAIEIHQLVDKLSPEFEKKCRTPLCMHTGINSGLVITGDKYIGKSRHGLTGDTINLAKRLTGIAKAGEIVLGHDTFLKIKESFTFDRLKSVSVKGKAKPVKTYKLRDIKNQVQEIDKRFNRQISSKMVGRDKELNTLELQTTKTIAGNGSVVNIVGEAGIGKSRLFAEFRHLDVIDRVKLLEGKAISIGRNLPFHPIIDLLKNWARIKEDDSEIMALGKLESSIRNIAGKDIDEILPFIATLMGMKLTDNYTKRIEGIEGEALEKLTIKNVRELLIKASMKLPLIIVIEDLHWADNSSIELLETLLKLTTFQPISFFNVFRPGYKDTGVRILNYIEQNKDLYFVTVQLGPLNKTMSESLINHMLKIKGLPHTVKDKIIDRAGGNPFFIEEVVRSFIDEGAIVIENDQFIVTQKIHSLTVPHSINDVLAARMDRLENETRELIKVASVIGRNFFHRILTEVASSIEDIETRLSYLKEIQLIREQKRFHELEYLFKHALAQEVAYESILHQKRKQLHLEVAQAIENVFNERLHEFYGLLALHWTRAEEWEKAEFYLVKAGEMALRSSASSEALNFYQEGLQLYLEHGKEKINNKKMAMFEYNIATAFYNKANWINAVTHIDNVFKLWKIPTTFNIVSVSTIFFKNILFLMTGLDHFFFKKNPTPRDNQIFDLSYKKGTATFSFDSFQFFLSTLSVFNKACRFNIAQSTDTFRAYTGAAALITLSGLPRVIAYKILKSGKKNMDIENIQSLISYKMICAITDCFSGNYKNCKTYDADIVEKAIKKGALFEASTYTSYLSYAQCEIGLFSIIESNIEKQKEISIDYGYNLATTGVHLLKTFLYIKKGHLNEAIDACEQAIAFARGEKEMGLIYQLSFLSLKAEAHILLNDLKTAEIFIQEAEQIVLQKAIIAPYAFSCYMYSLLLFNLKSLETAMTQNDSIAISTFQRKVKIHLKTVRKKFSKIAVNRTKTYSLIGSYYWLINKQNTALKWWKKSIQTGEALDARPDLSRTYFEVGKSLQSPQSKYKRLNDMTSDIFLDKAKIMFKELELAWDLKALTIHEEQFNDG